MSDVTSILRFNLLQDYTYITTLLYYILQKTQPSQKKDTQLGILSFLIGTKIQPYALWALAALNVLDLRLIALFLWI